jgi:methenyltetrahydromethanopterin cyclohydrolase
MLHFLPEVFSDMPRYASSTFKVMPMLEIFSAVALDAFSISTTFHAPDKPTVN